MNSNHLEQLLLLEQSGELTATQRRALDAELAANPDARRLRAELRGLARTLPPAPGPSPDATARIAARLETASRPRPAWKPAFAAAAALALLLGVQLFRPGSPSADTELARSDTPATVENAPADDWTDPLADEFTELENLLTALSAEDPFGFAEL